MHGKKAMKLQLCVCLFLFFWITCITELNAQEAKPSVMPSIEAAVRAFEQHDLQFILRLALDQSHAPRRFEEGPTLQAIHLDRAVVFRPTRVPPEQG
jgi:hypothetical protein